MTGLFGRFASVAAVLLLAAPALAAETEGGSAGPAFHVDTSWPKLPLPRNWALGELAGVFVDKNDHVWIIQRPRTLNNFENGAAASPPRASCCVPAPPVIAFDQAGNVVHAWGGPAQGYDWPSIEHGISVDSRGNVWIGGSATRPGTKGEPPDGMLLKFSQDGKFLMQIGHAGPSKGSLDTTQLAGVAGVSVSAATNEVYVADGYGNHRVIVFDADTGKFKRLWGAYGRAPTDEKVGQYDPDAPPAKQFRNVHCVHVANDGTVYVCDRDNDRMQIFKSDGSFVREQFFAKETRPPGTVGDIAFWPDRTQSLMAVADLGNFQIRIVRRSDGAVLSIFGHFGAFAGELNRIHQIAFDSHGNLYTSEAGKRIQKFVPDKAPSP
jgi:hypothetical protein